jgi:hypothetical protein
MSTLEQSVTAKDVPAVPRQFVREHHELTRERPADPAQDRDGEDDRHEDRRYPTEPPPLEGAYHRTHEEREQDGQRHRDQHGLEPVQGHHDERDDPLTFVHVATVGSRVRW